MFLVIVQLISIFTSAPSRNAVIMVSATFGADDVECGSDWGLSACKTIIYASKKKGDLDILVDVGNYTESTGVAVSGELNITGQNVEECILAKPHNGSFVLFTLNISGSSLTISNLTVIFGNDSKTLNFIRSSGIKAKVSATFSNCRISMESGQTQIYGGLVYINNTLASIEFSGCTVFNITTSFSEYPIIYSYGGINTLCISNSSFVNIHNTQSDGTGSLFLLWDTTNLTLAQSVFEGCYSNNYGVGRAYPISGPGSAITGCTFWNNTASSYAGALYLGSSSSFNREVYITNTSFTYCNGSPAGAVYLTAYIRPFLADCSFTLCTASSGRAGALSLFGCLEANITHCTFVACSGLNGGAVYLYNTHVNVTETVFVGNGVEEEGNGADVYVDNSLVDFIHTYTDTANESVSVFYYSSSSTPGNTILTADDYYSNVTCKDFVADVAVDHRCSLPCAFDSTRSACVLPDGCPAAYTAVGGVCVPLCSFWDASSPACTRAATNTSTNKKRGLNEIRGNRGNHGNHSRASRAWLAQAQPLCTVDEQLGCPLCAVGCTTDDFHTGQPDTRSWGLCELRVCSARTKTNTDPLSPCGPDDYSSSSSPTCIWDMGRTDDPNTCIPSTTDCTASAHYTKEGSLNRTCVLKPCVERGVDETREYPCGSVDCLLDGGSGGEGEGEGEGGGSEASAASAASPSSSSTSASATAAALAPACVVVCTNPNYEPSPALDGRCVEKQQPEGEGEGEGGKQKGLSRTKIIILIVAVVGGILVLVVLVVVVVVVVRGVRGGRGNKKGGKEPLLNEGILVKTKHSIQDD